MIPPIPSSQRIGTTSEDSGTMGKFQASLSRSRVAGTQLLWLYQSEPEWVS